MSTRQDYCETAQILGNAIAKDAIKNSNEALRLTDRIESIIEAEDASGKLPNSTSLSEEAEVALGELKAMIPHWIS